ncbi:hypothetical protein SLE2022_343230 [Rubroshorea leprosula]
MTIVKTTEARMSWYNIPVKLAFLWWRKKKECHGFWWDYVTEFALRCSMKERKYNKDCADQIIHSLGVDLKKINECIGNPMEDEKNPILEAEQNAQGGKGSHTDTNIVPSLKKNGVKYQGKLERKAVLQAICSELPKNMNLPAICLHNDA